MTRIPPTVGPGTRRSFTAGRAPNLAAAPAALFLASDASAWITGVTLDVAGAGAWSEKSTRKDHARPNMWTATNGEDE